MISIIDEKQLMDISGSKLFDITCSYFNTKAVDRQIKTKYLECLKYLFLVSKYYDKLEGKFMPLTQDVDEIWHFIIIQTRQYMELCNRLPGNFFLHHQSLSFDSYIAKDISRQDSIKEMLMWIPLYIDNFGCFNLKTGKYWKIVRYLNVSLNMSYDCIAKLKFT
jgi:hypothetical protein